MRPRPEPGRDLEKFRRYTEGWQRAAAEEPSAGFRVWSSDAGPPTHSVPAHLVAKAAALLGRHAFERMHWALLSAYFEHNRDISHAATLRAIWLEVGLPEQAFASADGPELLKQVAEEHNAAIELGVGGVPAMQIEGGDAAITGAHPAELYRRWIRKQLEEEAR